MSRRVKEDWSFGVLSRGFGHCKSQGRYCNPPVSFLYPRWPFRRWFQFVPLGRVSRLVSRHLLGLSRARLGKIDDISSIVLLVLFVIRVISNYRLSYGEVSIW